MGKKVRKVPYLGGWADPQLNKDYQKNLLENRNNPVFKGTKGLLYDNVISKKKKQDLSKEELELGEELKAEREYEEALRQQEEELKVADEFSKLTETQKQVIGQLAKNKKLDTRNLSSLFSDKDISEYFNTAKEYNKLRDNDSFLKDEKESNELADKEKGFFNLDNWKANISLGWDVSKVASANLINSILNRGLVGNNSKEREKYEKLKNKIVSFEKPIATQWLKNVDTIKEKYKDKITPKEEVWNQYGSNMKFGLPAGASSSLVGYASLDEETKGALSGHSFNEKSRESLEDFINDKNNIFTGAETMSEQLATSGLLELNDNIRVYLLKKKMLDNKLDFNSLSDNEKYLLESYNAYQDVNKLELAKDKFWYRTGQGVAYSTVFIEQNVAAPLFGGNAVSAVVSPLAKKASMGLAMKSLSYAEGTNVAKALEFLATKGIGYVEKGGIGTGVILS